MRPAVTAFAIATVVVGALHRGSSVLLGWSVLRHEIIFLAVIGIALGLLATSRHLAEYGVWRRGGELERDAGSLVTRVATVGIALNLVLWMLGISGLWLLPGDDNSAWLRIASASSFGSAAPVDQGVAVAVFLTLAVGVTRMVFWCVNGGGTPWEIVTWSVVGGYGALAVVLPTLAHRAFRRRSARNGDFGFSVLLVQVTVTVFAIEAIRLGHLTALLLCVGLISSLPQASPTLGARLNLMRWIPFACCLSIWLGTVPLSLALLGAITVASLVSSRSSRLVAVVVGVVITALIGQRFSRFLPWGGSVAQIQSPTILAIMTLVIFVLIRKRSFASVLTVVSAYACALAAGNLWRSGSIDYGVSKVIWILVPVVLLEVLAHLGPASIQSLVGRPSDTHLGLPRSLSVVVVMLSVTAVAWTAIPALSTSQPLGSARDVVLVSHWRDLGSASPQLPAVPVGCLAIDKGDRPLLTSDALYRCNRFITALAVGSAHFDDRLGQVFRSYAAGGVGLGGLLETVGTSGVSPSRILLIDGDGQITSTTLSDVAR